MRDTIIPQVGTNIPIADQILENNSAKFRTLGFAVLIILGIGGLIAASLIGGLFHAGALSSLGQVNSMVMIIIGGGGGIPLLAIGIIGFVNGHPCNRDKAAPNSMSEEKKQTQQKVAEQKKAQSKCDTVFNRTQKNSQSDEEKQIQIVTEQQNRQGLTNSGVHINQLPIDVLTYIFRFFTCEELITVSLVCKTWKQLSDSNRVWTNLFMTTFGKPYGLSAIDNYKSKYKQYLEGLPLSEAEYITCGTDSIVCVGYERIIICYPYTDKVADINIPGLGATCRAAMENKTLVLCTGDDQVCVFTYNEIPLTCDEISQKGDGLVSKCQLQRCLQYTHAPQYTRVPPPDFSRLPKIKIAIYGDIVATANGNSTQVWNYTSQNLLWEFSLDEDVWDIAIHNDTLTCCCCHKTLISNNWSVEILSLQTRTCLRRISVAGYAGVYRNYIVGSSYYDATTVCSLESEEPIWTLPQEMLRPWDICKSIVYNKKLICLTSSPYKRFVTIWELETGRKIRKIDLAGFVDENTSLYIRPLSMSMQGNNLVIFAFATTTGSQIKMWKFAV